MTNPEAEAVTAAILNLMVSVIKCSRDFDKKYSNKKTRAAARERAGARIRVCCNELVEKLEDL
jgi:hypothetical protein